VTTSGTSLAFWPGPDHGGGAGQDPRLSGWIVEEDSSGRAMQALIDTAAVHDGAAVAVPHRGHFIPLGRPHEWQLLLEEVTGHPLVFTSHTQ
jgi:hypothetical protein